MELRVDQGAGVFIEAGRDIATPVSRQRALPGPLLVASLIVTDAMAICVAFTIAFLVRFRLAAGLFYDHDSSPLSFYSSLVFWLAPMVLAIFAGYQLYNVKRLFDGPQEYARIVSATTLSMMLVVLLSFLFDAGLVISRGWIVISWIALAICVGLGRFMARRVVYALRRAGRLGRRVIIVGSGRDASDLAARLAEDSGSGLRIVSVIDGESLQSEDAHGTGALARLIAATGAEAVIVSAASVSQAALSRIVREVSQLPAELQLVPGMHEILTTGVQVTEVRGLPLVTMNKVRITGVDLALKTALDYGVAFLTLLAMSPLLLLIAAAIRLTSPGPVFHHRDVIGQQGRRFAALKFRTMRVDGDEIMRARPDLLEQLQRHGKIVDDPRVTPLGKLLRRTSLDELPQLLNVLRGEMSLVGPRMITAGELDHFGHWRENLCTVKPGLTGLWQVSGRSQLGYEDRVRLDMHYIRAYSIWSDLEILLRTVPAVIHGTGAY